MATVTLPERDTKTKSSNLVEMSWDPVTRIVGSLGIYTKIDFANRQVAECHSTSSIFRGYSIFMKGKDPRDAHFITSRICGICGDNHATCACYAQNMAFGIRPPAMGEWIVNLAEAAEYIFDHDIFQDNLVGVDFCEQMVKETNPGVWDKAQRTPAPNASIHHYKTIADIMPALNPFTGDFYREALQMRRMTRKMFCLMEESCPRDEVVSGLLLLHGLHPDGLEDRVAQALEQVRPALQSHGGNVELLDVREGVVHLRLEGNCHGCPSSAATMKSTIEEAILAHAPEIVSIEVQGLNVRPTTPDGHTLVELSVL